MTRVLVTGATGFIGRHLVKQLSEAGHDVTCLTRKTSRTQTLRSWSPRLVEGNVLDPASLHRAAGNQDVVFHLAGLTRSLRKPDLYAVNARGTANVVESCSQQDTPPTLVIVSSLAAAGPAPSGLVRCEMDEPGPVSHYGKSKLQGEQLAIQSAADRMPISIVRPPIVFGEGDRDCLNLFKGIADSGLHFVPTTRNYRYSLIHVSDLCTALQQVAWHGQRCRIEDPVAGTYFAAAEEQPAYAELGRLIGRSVGRIQVRVIHTPGWFVQGLGVAGQMLGQIRRQATVINPDKAREAVAGSWACSNEKILADTGFHVTTPLQSRLKQTADWYFAEGWIRPRNRHLDPARPARPTVQQSREKLFGTSRQVNQ